MEWWEEKDMMRVGGGFGSKTEEEREGREYEGKEGYLLSPSLPE